MSDKRPVIVGSRGSTLALAQTREFVNEALRHHLDLDLRIKAVPTRGEEDQAGAPGRSDRKGLFTADLETALLAGEIDWAVHSAKDLPAGMPEGLAILCVPPRGDPRDALVSPRGWAPADVPPGTVVGTSSRRRAAQWAILRPDVPIRPIHGNVDTRLTKMHRGEYGALILAAAGLERIGRLDDTVHALSIEEMVPAAGQGTLAVQGRVDDFEAVRWLSALHDRGAELCLSCERRVVAGLQAGCDTPVGAFARIQDATMTVIACVVHPGGNPSARARAEGPCEDSAGLADRTVCELMAQGAREIMDSCR